MMSHAVRMDQTPRPARPATGPVPAAGLWRESRADKLMKGIACMLFTYVWRVQDIFPVMGALHVPLLATGASLLMYSASRQPWRRMVYLQTPIVKLVLGIFVVMIAGIPGSLWRGHSLSFAFQDYAQNIVFMGLVAVSIRSVRDVEWFTAVNLWGAVFYAMFVNLTFQVGPDGRLSNLVYYDANDFGLVMVCTIPFAVYFLRSQSGPRRRLLGLVALGLFTLGIMKSGSRGGFLGLIAVMLYVLLRYRAIPARIRLTAALGGVALLGLLATGQYWDLMQTMMHPQSDYNFTDPSGRIGVWTRGLGYVKEHPLLGVGVGSFPIAEGTVSEIGRELASRGAGFMWSVAHNSFLETAAELGIPGFLLFVAVLGTTLWTMARIRPGQRYGPLITRRETALGQMLVGSMFGFMVSGFFVSAEYFSYLYFLIGLAVGLDKVLRLQGRATMTALAAYMPPVRTSRVPPGAQPPLAPALASRPAVPPQP